MVTFYSIQATSVSEDGRCKIWQQCAPHQQSEGQTEHNWNKFAEKLPLTGWVASQPLLQGSLGRVGKDITLIKVIFSLVVKLQESYPVFLNTHCPMDSRFILQCLLGYFNLSSSSSSEGSVDIRVDEMAV